MNFRSRLSERVQISDIREILFQLQGDSCLKQELYDLLFDREDTVAYQAAWVMCHFSRTENQWLFDKQDELIDEVLICSHPGKRRLLLHLLYKQPLADPPRVDFLDFSLEHMLSREELPGVQTLCMKLAYELCRSEPELLRELKTMLEIMEADFLPISLRTVRRHVLNAIKTGKSLQKY